MKKNNVCAGTYIVSGYIRADGTKVSDYTRTCGAAHNSNGGSTNSLEKGNLSDEEKLKQRADILYSTMDNKQNKKVHHELKNEIGVDLVDIPIIKSFGMLYAGKEAAENLHMSKTKSYMNTEYAKNHVIFNSYKDVNSDLQDYFKEKITKQLELEKVSQEVREKILNSTKGIYIGAQSESSKKLSETLTKEPKFVKLLASSIKKMKKGLSVEDSLLFTDKNFHNALGKADIKFMHINRQGNIDLLVTDVYDFNPNSSSDLVRVGRDRQEKGEITPYFVIYHVIIPKNRKIR